MSRPDKTFSYDRFLIRFIVVVAYVGWAAYTSISLLPAPDTPPVLSARKGIVDVFTLLTFFGSAIAFWIQNAPWTFYVYVAFPCYFWRVFYLRGVPSLLRAVSQSSFSSRQLCTYGLLVIVSLQSMVVCPFLRPEVMAHRSRLQAAYTYRYMWSVGFIIIGVLWPYYGWPSSALSQNRQLALQWAFSCLVTSVFPLLPVDKQESLPTM